MGRVNPVARAVLDAEGNANAGILLYRIRYWQPKAVLEREQRRWIAKTYAEWAEECGLSERQVRRAMDFLAHLGLLDKSRRRFKGGTILFITLERPRLRVVPGGSEGRRRTGSSEERVSESGHSRVSESGHSLGGRVSEIGHSRVSESGHSLRQRGTDREIPSTERARTGHTRARTGIRDFTGEEDHEEEKSPLTSVSAVEGPTVKVSEVLRQFQTEDTVTEADVWARAERLSEQGWRRDGGVKEMSLIWRDAQRAADVRGRWVPTLPATGKMKTLVSALDSTMPAGTAPFVVALLGFRWDSFKDFLVRTRGWEARRIGAPSLALAVSQVEAVAEWMGEQEAPDASTVESALERLRSL